MGLVNQPGEKMHAGFSRVMLVFCLVCSALLAQAPPPRTPVEQKDTPTELGPATSPTTEKAGDAVKTPVGPTPMPTAAPVDPKTFKIGAEDILLVRVWREPELSSAVEVRPDGKITLPLIGEVQAADETADSLKSKVVELLSEYINKPEVMVSIQAVRSRRYYLTGEVMRPGAYPLVVPVTLLEALTNAGGFKEFANTKKITVLRKGTEKPLKFNYNDVIKGKNMEQNIKVENGDFIHVP
jgi:polysaccharide export outer membrane protein